MCRRSIRWWHEIDHATYFYIIIYQFNSQHSQLMCECVRCAIPFGSHPFGWQTSLTSSFQKHMLGQLMKERASERARERQRESVWDRSRATDYRNDWEWFRSRVLAAPILAVASVHSMLFTVCTISNRIEKEAAVVGEDEMLPYAQIHANTSDMSTSFIHEIMQCKCVTFEQWWTLNKCCFDSIDAISILVLV